MATLSLASVEACIMAAYENYLSGTTGDFNVETGDGTVGITCRISGTQFNCGFPGFKMAAADKSELRGWCASHPGPDPGSQRNWILGFRDIDRDHEDLVNVTLIHRTYLMFNFHVYLAL